jgi:hypothetical protein
VRVLDWLLDIPDGLSSWRHGLAWNGRPRLRGRGLLPRPCGICGQRTRGATDFLFFIEVNKTVTEQFRLKEKDRICGDCWQRHLDLEPEVREHRRAEEQLRFRERLRHYRRWLDHAPRRVPAIPDKEPDPVTLHRAPLLIPPRPGQEPGTVRPEDVILKRTQWFGGSQERWILDIDTLAEQIALREGGSPDSFIGGPDAKKVMSGHKCAHGDALSMSYGDDDFRDSYTGTAYRLDDARILIVWKHERSYSFG